MPCRLQPSSMGIPRLEDFVLLASLGFLAGGSSNSASISGDSFGAIDSSLVIAFPPRVRFLELPVSLSVVTVGDTGSSRRYGSSSRLLFSSIDLTNQSKLTILICGSSRACLTVKY